MLRLAVLVLLLANGGYYAWSQGWLVASFGLGPAQQSEPQRVAQQIRPEMIVVTPASGSNADAAPASFGTTSSPPGTAATPRSAECLQAGPFDDAAAQPVRRALESWPLAAWSFEPATEPARWIVYVGKVADAAALNKKKAELRQLGVSFETLANPALEPGVSLGGFGTQAAANDALTALAARGVRTARVVQERGEVKGSLLKLPAVDDALRGRLDELRPVLGAKTLRSCR